MSQIVSVKEIRDKALRLWTNGQVFSALLNAEEIFPIVIPFRKPTSKELLHHFSELRENVEQLVTGSKSTVGNGYSIVFREVKHRSLGLQKVPHRILFEQREDFLRFLRKESEFRKVQEIFRETQTFLPALAPWVVSNPLKVVELSEIWTSILDICRFFKENPSPNLYVRELQIPGIDSKFIERHRALLAELLNVVVPKESIDENVSRLSGVGFERRYGLKFDEPRVRYRILEARDTCYTDLSVLQSEFAKIEIPCEKVFIVENVQPGLAFPNIPESILIFGMGYGVTGLRGATWLQQREVFYWGDLDTHGFAILSACRSFLPNVRSLMMDEETLRQHSNLWVEEPESRRFMGSLVHLTDKERELFQALQFNRFGHNVRLEQERIERKFADSVLMGQG